MESYPEHLLPSEDREILDSGDIKSKEAARWHDSEKQGSIFDQNGNINAELIDYHRFPRFSINLIPPSRCQDVKILLLDKDLENSWKPGEPVPEVNSSDFKFIEEREVFKFNTDDITSAELSYLINGNAFLLTIEIIHKPLRANYSHCEFKLLPTHPQAPLELSALTSKKAYHRILISNLRRLMEKYCSRCN